MPKQMEIWEKKSNDNAVVYHLSMNDHLLSFLKA